MMGLNPSLSWIAWFLKYLGFMLVAVFFMTLLLMIDLGNGAIINLSDPIIMFTFLLLYATSTIMFAFAISTLFTKCKFIFTMQPFLAHDTSL